MGLLENLQLSMHFVYSSCLSGLLNREKGTGSNLCLPAEHSSFGALCLPSSCLHPFQPCTRPVPVSLAQSPCITHCQAQIYLPDASSHVPTTFMPRLLKHGQPLGQPTVPRAASCASRITTPVTTCHYFRPRPFAHPLCNFPDTPAHG